MPVARTDSRRAILVALAGLVAAVGLAALVLVAADGGGGTTSSSGEFGGLDAAELVRLQERDGVPTLFPDLASGDQPIFVWHEGEDPESGWVAYDAQVEGCALGFERGDDELTNACTGQTFPFSGEGLAQYPVRVVDGELVVDLDG